MLKIDKSFVDGMAVSRQRQALVEVIVRIARTLRLTVVAEGIESEVQRDLLVSMGCRYGRVTCCPGRCLRARPRR